MNIFQVPVSHVGIAWRDGAHLLSQATMRAEREITSDQLKMLLMRGERILLGIADEGKTPAWAAVQIQQLPNLRTLYVYAIYAPGYTGAEPFMLLKDYAKGNGCEVIRGACDEAVGRLWQRGGIAKVIYSIYEIDV